MGEEKSGRPTRWMGGRAPKIAGSRAAGPLCGDGGGAQPRREEVDVEVGEEHSVEPRQREELPFVQLPAHAPEEVKPPLRLPPHLRRDMGRDMRHKGGRWPKRHRPGAVVRQPRGILGARPRAARRLLVSKRACGAMWRHCLEHKHLGLPG